MRGIFCLASIALALAACQPGTGVRGPLYQVDPFPSSAPPGAPSSPSTGVNTSTGASSPWYLDGGTTLGANLPDAGFFPNTGTSSGTGVGIGGAGTAGSGTLGAFDGGTSQPIGGLGTPGFVPPGFDGGTSSGVGGAGFGADAGTQ